MTDPQNIDFALKISSIISIFVATIGIIVSIFVRRKNKIPNDVYDRIKNVLKQAQNVDMEMGALQRDILAVDPQKAEEQFGKDLTARFIKMGRNFSEQINDLEELLSYNYDRKLNNYIKSIIHENKKSEKNSIMIIEHLKKIEDNTHP